MQKGSLSRGMSAMLVLLGLLAGCQGGGSGGTTGGGSTGAGTARVHIQVGDGTPTLRGASTRASGVTRQRVGGIPPDVVQITLRVTTNGQDISGSPFTLSLETGTVSVDITANLDHLFLIEISNHRGDIIFHGEATANLRSGVETDLPITLAPREVTRLVATQNVSALRGGEVVVTDPQSTVQGLRLLVPPQALTQDTTFMVVEANNPSNVPVLQSQAGVIVDLLQNGTTFAVLATLVFPYNPTLVQELGFSEVSLRVWRFDTVAGQWAPVPQQTVDTVNHVISAQLTSLSFYTVGGPPPPPPPNRRPVADAQFVTTAEDTARDIVLTGSDADNDALTFHIVNEPTRGTLHGTPPMVTYVPDMNVNGRDAFTFVVNDEQQDSIPATVTIDVTPASDMPIVVTPLPNVLVDDSTSDTGAVLNLMSVFSDVDSVTNADTLLFTISNNTNPTLVTATLVGTILTLTYQPRQHGSAMITVRATDQSGLFVDTSVTVVVERTFPFVLGLSRLGDVSQRLSGRAN